MGMRIPTNNSTVSNITTNNNKSSDNSQARRIEQLKQLQKVGVCLYRPQMVLSLDFQRRDDIFVLK